MSEAVLSNPGSKIRTQIAVIGSGPGGAMTAAVLAAGGREVLIIEEGPFLPQESCQPFTLEEMAQKYRNGGVTITMGGSAKIAYAEGRCVGGGSEVNAGLYYRTPAEVLEQWCESFEIEQLNSELLAPHFEYCEHELAIAPLPIELQRSSAFLHQGAQMLGWDALEVPRWMSFSNGQWSRRSMSKTLLPKAFNSGARLLHDTRVLKIARRGSGWILKAIKDAESALSQLIDIEAETVFVCCGAVHTPALLRRSGVKKNVGLNIKLHPMIKVVASFPGEVNHLSMGVSAYQIREFGPKITLGGSISTPPYLALPMLNHPQHLLQVYNNWRSMLLFYAQVVGGRGRVNPVPFHRDPVLRYGLDEETLCGLSDALKALCRLLLKVGADALYPNVHDHPIVRSERDIAAIPRPLPPSKLNLTSVHLMGSCPMGENRERCATDSFGRVHGMENLYIADGSLLGGALGVNPQGSIMAYARRNAQHFLEHGAEGARAVRQ